MIGEATKRRSKSAAKGGRCPGSSRRRFVPRSLRRWFTLACAGTALILPGWACRPASNSTGSGSPSLIISGDTNGWITPCGCATNQSGGLPRRGSYLARARQKGEVAYADVGGAPVGTGEYQKLKFEAILQGEAQLGIVAHNLGGPEASFGADYLRDIAARLGTPFISANLRDARGERLADASRIISLGGRRVALIGVVSPRLVGSPMRADEPRDAILAALAAIKGRYDSVVILAYLMEQELADLPGAVPEADVIVGGPTGQSLAPRRIGPALLTSATNKGKFMVHLAVPPPGNAGWAAKLVELDKGIADDPAQVRNLRDFRARLGQRDFTAAQSGLVGAMPAGTPRDYQVAGSQSCIQCHPADQQAWVPTHHAGAWKDLEDRQAHVDPFCQQCHVTAYGLPGGFESIARTPGRVAVGCEDCHGPSWRHVQDPAIHTLYAAKDQCVHCHDRENSPMFRYDEYWKQIRHGDVKATKRTASVAPATQREAGQ